MVNGCLVVGSVGMSVAALSSTARYSDSEPVFQNHAIPWTVSPALKRSQEAPTATTFPAKSNPGRNGSANPMIAKNPSMIL